MVQSAITGSLSNRVGRLQKGRQTASGWVGPITTITLFVFAAHLPAWWSSLSAGVPLPEALYAGCAKLAGGLSNGKPGPPVGSFLDVDLAPEEVDADFSRQALPEQESLGTIGLWCALHGDSIFEAGMHHLAVRCDFHRLNNDIAKFGESFMATFSNFPS
ncbi:MAG: hypothetical protein R2864_08235 [Syntrophotaleaceae bacterium]